MTEPTDTAETSRLMARRYGVGSPRRRGLMIAAIVIGGLILLGWLLWAAWVQATRTVSGAVVSFEVVSAHRIDVTVDIRRPAEASVRCTVQAQAVDHSVVGQAVVSVPAGGDTSIQVETSIKTDREATSADVSDCR